MSYKILFFLCIFFIASVSAQEPGLQENLALDQAIVRVLENNPRLKVVDYQSQAMAARMRQALQKPADRISMTLENFAGTDETVAVRALEATLSLSRTLELGNKAASRGQVVESETQLLRNQNDIDRLNLLADTAQRFVHVAADQERMRLIEESMQLIKRIESTVEERIRVGKSPVSEKHRALIDLANHDIEHEHIRHELENSRVSLSTLWGSRLPDFDRVLADIYQLDELPDFQQLAEQLDRNPQITRHLRAEDLARARIKLAQDRRTPDIDVSGGFRYLGGSNDVAVMLWASIPLGSHSRVQPAIDEAEAMAATEPFNLEQQKLELYSLLFEIYQEMKHAREASQILEERIIPAAERMLADYEQGYSAGRYSLLELIQTQQQLQDARSRLLELAADFHGRKIEIDRLTAAQLTEW